MKNNIIRFLYAILGVWIGFEACNIRNAEGGNVGIVIYLIFVTLGVIYSFVIKEQYLDTTLKQIIGLVFGFVLSYPIAYILQYLVLVCVLIKDIVVWLLQFQIIQIFAVLFIFLIVVVVGYFIYDQIKYSKK